MNQMFQGMKQSMQQMTPERWPSMREMVRDLNQMLRDKAEGREPKFEEFKQKHGQFFPPNINSWNNCWSTCPADAAMDSLMQSMSPEQRARVAGHDGRACCATTGCKWELAQLAANLQELMPYEGQRYPFSGDEPVTLSEAMRMMDQLQQMEQLEQQLQNARFDGNNVDNIDPHKVAELLGAGRGPGAAAVAGTGEDAGGRGLPGRAAAARWS